MLETWRSKMLKDYELRMCPGIFFKRLGETELQEEQEGEENLEIS
jgi:hypothetical protein